MTEAPSEPEAPPPRASRGWPTRLLSLGFAVIVLVVAVTQADIDFAEVGRAFGRVTPAQVLATATLALLLQPVYAARWRQLLLIQTGIVPSLSVLTRHTFVSNFFGLAAPGGAQLVAQGWLTRKEGGGGVRPWAALVAERLVSLAALPLVSGFALLLLPGFSRLAGLALVVASSLGLWGLTAAPWMAGALRRRLPERLAVVTDVIDALGARGRLRKVLGLACVTQILMGTMGVVLFYPLGGAQLGDVVAATLLGLIAGVLPQVVGLGPGQVAQVALVEAAGCPLEGAAAMTLVWWGASMIVPLVGGLFLLAPAPPAPGVEPPA